MNYFHQLSKEEVQRRNEALDQADHDRRLLCKKIMDEYKKGLRKQKKKR